MWFTAEVLGELKIRISWDIADEAEATSYKDNRDLENKWRESGERCWLQEQLGVSEEN